MPVWIAANQALPVWIILAQGFYSRAILRVNQARIDQQCVDRQAAQWVVARVKITRILSWKSYQVDC